MIEWACTLIAVPAAGAVVGWLSGRPGAKRGGSPSSRPEASILFLLVFIALLAGARSYAETDYPGWSWAEWLAFSGKWYVLLAFIIQISTLPDVRHATLLLRFDGTNVHLIDPDYGYQIMDRPWVSRVMYGKAMVFDHTVPHHPRLK